MKLLTSLRPLLLAFCCAQLSATAACVPVSITTQRIHKAADKKYQALISGERKRGNVLIPKQTVQWRFEGKVGEFLLAEVQNKQSSSCVAYILRNDTFLPLGGNDHCSWSSTPKLIQEDKKAWIEFRPVVKQPPTDPHTINEFTAHFRKGTGDVCMLGLPSSGYESLSCPDEDAPASQ